LLWQKLIDKLIRPKIASPGAWNISTYQSGRPYYPDVSYKALLDKYESWVYACAHKNAISCAQIPLRLYVSKPSRRAKALFPTKSLDPETKNYLAATPTAQKYVAQAVDVEEVLEHPFLDLLERVNSFMNQFDLFETTVLHQELTGNAYWYLVTDNSGLPVEIWPLLPHRVRIIPDKQKFIAGYEYALSEAQKHVLEPESVVHFMYINPQNVYYGMGPLQAAVLAADLAHNMNLYETSLFANRAWPDLAMVLPAEYGTPSEEEIRRIQQKWRQGFGGVRKAGKLAILHGGADIKPLSLSPREMAYLQGRKATFTEICGVFGVPPSKIVSEDVNRANAEAGDYAYMKDTIRPRLRKIEQKINEKLLPRYDERLFCLFDNPVPEDKDYRLKEIQTHLKTGFSTINEERRAEGFAAVPWGDVPIMPINMAPVGTPAPEQESRPQTKANLPPLGHPTNFVNQPFVRAVAAHFQAQYAEILRKLNATTFRALKGPADDYVSGWFDMARWREDLAERTESFVRYTLLAGGEKALKQLVTDRPFNALSPAVLHALEHYRTARIAAISEHAPKQVRAAVAAGLAAGEGAAQIRKRIQEIYDDLTSWQAERIARTETIWAWNEGAQQGYIQSGLVEKKQWVSSGDARSCDYCLSMDGRIVGIRDCFFQRGTEHPLGGLKFDYEDIEHPPLHPNCRCTIVAVLEGV